MRPLLALSLVLVITAAPPAQAITIKAFNGSMTRFAETPAPLAAMAGREGAVRAAPRVRSATPAFTSVLAGFAAWGLPAIPIGPRAAPAPLANVPPWFGPTPPYGPPRGVPPLPRAQTVQDPPAAVPAAAALPLLLSALIALSLAARRRA